MAQRIRVTHLLLAGGLVLAAQPALAQEGMFFKNLLEGVVGGRGQGDDIDYRERAPLVVPPNSALPRPQDPGSARNAAWPTDPDVERRRNEKNVVPYVLTEKARNNTLLSQEELRRGRISARTPQQPNIPAADNNNYENQIKPIIIGKEVAAHRNQEAETALTYGSEPPRRMLTEPPVGYRMPAASAALGPGRSGPVEDKQASGQREFVTGQRPVVEAPSE
ncbi:hypothetical protein [Bosea sp. (in: a-proteobacteria)]|uniref:hypothetical protein n=1 Tax=Bosea sp. (in: a-proteobacteria) TaxID=1871050 RepID=UPI003341A98C